MLGASSPIILEFIFFNDWINIILIFILSILAWATQSLLFRIFSNVLLGENQKLGLLSMVVPYKFMVWYWQYGIDGWVFIFIILSIFGRTGIGLEFLGGALFSCLAPPEGIPLELNTHARFEGTPGASKWDPPSLPSAAGIRGDARNHAPSSWGEKEDPGPPPLSSFESRVHKDCLNFRPRTPHDQHYAQIYRDIDQHQLEVIKSLAGSHAILRFIKLKGETLKIESLSRVFWWNLIYVRITGLKKW